MESGAGESAARFSTLTRPAFFGRIVAVKPETRINSEIPDLICSLFRRAIALGHGHRDIAAVYEALRADAPPPT